MQRLSPIFGVFAILYFLVALVCVVAFVWVAVLLIQFLKLKNRQLRERLYGGEPTGGEWGHRQRGPGYPAEQQGQQGQQGQQWPGQQPQPGQQQSGGPGQPWAGQQPPQQPPANPQQLPTNPNPPA